MAVIESKGLYKYYRKRAVVNDVSIQVSTGEVVGLLGPNGAGKTTTFYMIIGFIRPDKGKVFFGKRNISSWPMYRRSRKGIGYLAQEASALGGAIGELAEEVEELGLANLLQAWWRSPFLHPRDRGGGLARGGRDGFSSGALLAGAGAGCAARASAM